MSKPFGCLGELDALARAEGWVAGGPSAATSASSFFTDGFGGVVRRPKMSMVGATA